MSSAIRRLINLPILVAPECVEGRGGGNEFIPRRFVRTLAVPLEEETFYTLPHTHTHGEMATF